MGGSAGPRLAAKTIEHQFLYALEQDFELAPAISRALLATAQQVLLPSCSATDVREGQMRITAVSRREPAGKPLAAMKKVAVVVTVDGGLEDLEIQVRCGLQGVRRVRLLRLCEEAVDQGGVLTQEDLSRLLQTGVRTIRRDIAALRAADYWVPTRGTVQEMGRGQSHKAKIVEFYLRRMTYSAIMRQTRHSAGAIKRYVETFGRVVVLWEKGLREAGEIAYVVGISERLAGEYLRLREQYAESPFRDRLAEIARQVRTSLPANGEEKGGS